MLLMFLCGIESFVCIPNIRGLGSDIGLNLWRIQGWNFYSSEG